MFEHEYFDKYAFEEVPLNRDIYLMDELWMKDYERAWLSFFAGGECENVGYISYAAARRVNKRSLELSWYANAHTRFHEVIVDLPRDQFVACVGCWRYDEKPHVFVNGKWLERLHLRSHSIFALIDAVGVRSALKDGLLTRKKLIRLRN